MTVFGENESGTGILIPGGADEAGRSRSRLPSDWNPDSTRAMRESTSGADNRPSAGGSSRMSRSQHTLQPRARAKLAGEVFIVETEAGVVYLRHPRWSLVGAGDSLVEAQVDLIEEASDLLVAMADMPVASLDADARRLREYLFRIASI